MARKGGKRGGSSAARSAAAKKGWETRRRGGAKPKPAATKRTAASKPKGNEYGTGVVAQRKKAMSARLVAAGKGIGTRNPQQAAYIRAQNINIIGQRLASEGKGNKAARRAAQLATKAKAAKTTARRGMPKTTSARGRALTNLRRAADLVRASRGGKGPSAKAVRSVLTAQRARAFYAATGGGKKRSAVKAKSAAKVGKQIRAQGRAKATAARAKVTGRPSARGKASRNSDARQRALINYNNALRKTASLDAGKKSDVAFATARRALDVYAGKKPSGRPIGFTSRARPSSGSTNVKAAQYRRIGEGSIEPGSTRKLLQSRAQVLRQASSATGLQRRTLLGMAGRQAEGLSISGSAPNRTGRGNNQLTRAGRRAAANYVRIERALANTPAGASRKKLQRRLDTAFAALASLPKTRLPR